VVILPLPAQALAPDDIRLSSGSAPLLAGLITIDEDVRAPTAALDGPGSAAGDAVLAAQGQDTGDDDGVARHRRKETEFRVLYVCTGNICRSPFAEILTRHLLTGRLGGQAAAAFDVSSAGRRRS
jgi:hypothetical protein